MAITINREEVISVPVNQAFELVSASPGRKYASFEVHSRSVTVWFALAGIGAGVAPRNGSIARGYEHVDIAAEFGGQGNSTDFYEGPIWIYLETKRNVATMEVGVIEAS